MIFLPVISKIVGILNDKASPAQVAAGFALGALVGLLPGFGLFSILISALIFLLNVNLSAALLAVPVFKVVGYVIDPLADKIGVAILTGIPQLAPLWTRLYNLPFVPFTRFNNTVVMGNLVLGLILFAPIFISVKKFVIAYRTKWRDRINRLRIVQIYKTGKLYNLWQTINKYRQG